MSHFPLPKVVPVPLDRFSPEYAALLESAALLPDGNVWGWRKDGVVIRIPMDPTPLQDALLRQAAHDLDQAA